MRVFLNLLWIICGGWLSALGWVFAGCLWCVTVVGIPVGMQCFKLSSISLNPFGKEVRHNDAGAGSFLMNVRLVQTINKNSVIGYFYGHKNNYLILDDYYYWYMDYPENLAVDLINRTTTDYLEYSNGVYYYKERQR